MRRKIQILAKLPQMRASCEKLGLKSIETPFSFTRAKPSMSALIVFSKPR